MSQCQSTAAPVQAKCIPHCSLLLCKPGSQQALCHCNCTYGHSPFIQVCSDPASIDCNTVQGKMHSPLLSAAVQARLTANTTSQSVAKRRPTRARHCGGPNAGIFEVQTSCWRPVIAALRTFWLALCIWKFEGLPACMLVLDTYYDCCSLVC